MVGIVSEFGVHGDRVAEQAAQVHPAMMADTRLRELARWEQADLETQVRLLRERMRAGEDAGGERG